MKKNTLIIALAAVSIAVLLLIFSKTGDPEPETSLGPESSWSEYSSPGELTQELSHFAVSTRTAPRLQMQYPYNQVSASIGFGCDKSDEWMYVAFSEAPNIANVESDEELNIFSANISFDDQPHEYAMTQKFGARFLQFMDDDWVSAKITESSSMTFAVNWYQEGMARFDFPLTGSAAAIESARQKCARR